MDAPLNLRLFGPMQVLVHGEPLPKVRSRKARWLLALLALRNGQPVSRSWVAGMLWPDAGASVSLANLRPVISELRQALGDQAYRLRSNDPSDVLLDIEGADVDVARFDAALVRDDWEGAVALYRGALLEGCPESWVPQERRTREQGCLNAFRRLAEREVAAERSASAISYRERAVAIAPYQDAPRRELMETLALFGDVNAALQVYREFDQALRSETGTVPDAATTDLYLRLRSGGPLRKQIPQPDPSANDDRIFGHLPHPQTPLVGREDERSEVRDRLGRYRLVTLTGGGGIGKTRLAHQVATEIAQNFEDGVWLVSLESLVEARQIGYRIASLLGVKEKPGVSILQTLGVELRTKKLLLILDNCEHLLEGAVEVCEHLLRECGKLKILATSREALGIPAEKVWPVPPLSAPDPDGLPADTATRLRVLEGYDAVRLFVERAQAARDGFSLTRDNSEAVARICSSLEGVPLAIELAAAHTRAMAVESIAERCGAPLTLLEPRRRGMASRRQTLRATLDWSYELLSPAERSLLAQLSCFRGGWNLAAAEAVCIVSESPSSISSLLTALIDQSMVSFSEAGGEGRYRTLEMVRQYAEGKLGTGADDLADRHLAWFLREAEVSHTKRKGPDQEQWLRKTEKEHDNLRAAFETARERDSESFVRLADAISHFWYVRGHHAEGRRMLQEALLRVESTLKKARLLCSAAILAHCESDYPPAKQFGEESLALYRQLGHEEGIAEALGILATVACLEGDYSQARTLYEEELAIRRRLGDARLIAFALGNLAQVLYPLGEAAAAKRSLEEALAVSRTIGEPRATAMSLFSLAQITLAEGDAEPARRWLEECLDLGIQAGESSGVGFTYVGLGMCAVFEENFEAARSTQKSALECFRQIGNPRGVAMALLTLGRAEIEDGRISVGKDQITECLGIARQIGDGHIEAYALRHLADVSCAHQSWDEGWSLLCQSLRLFLSGGDRIGAIPVFQSLAAVWRQFDPGRAIRFLAVCRKFEEDSGSKQPPFKVREFERLADSLRSAVGDAAFDAAWVGGLGLDWEQATAEVLDTEALVSAPAPATE